MGYFAALIIFIWGAGSLYLVAVKTDSVKSVFLKRPSIIIGDFFIIPLVGGYIINYFYSTGKALNEVFSPMFLVVIGLVAIALAIISAVRFKTLGALYYPHGLFYAFISFLILLFLIGRFDLKSYAWWFVLVGISTHLLLGYLYPKKFPEIK